MSDETAQQLPGSIEQGLAPELVTVLMEVGQSLAVSLSTDAVLAAALEVVQRVLRAEASSIFLTDPDSGDLRLYLADPEHEGALKSFVQPKGKGLSGLAVEQGKAILVADAYKDPRFDPTADARSGFRTRSVISVPLRVLGENLGVIQVLNKKDGGSFTQRELILLQAVASLVALALDNARTHEELLRTHRLATIGETIASLAHCIKNVLSGINAGAFFINEAIGKEDLTGVKKGWQIADSNMKFLSELVLNMLSFARRRKPILQATDVNRLCNEVVSLLAEQARQQEVELMLEPHENLPKVKLDSVGLRRCLVNLVGNAIDACAEKKGKVTISIDGDSDDCLYIRIADTGSGMAAETLEKLFTLFFSTKGNRGTGLGLPVSKKIIEEHGGQLKVDSVLDQGTRVTIVLPINSSQERNLSMAEQTRTALVVDDEAVARDFHRAILESMDWNVIEASDGESARKSAIEHKPQLILLDVQMPGESGFSVFADLRENQATADIPIIMVTGVAEKTGIKFSSKEMGEFIGKEPEAYLEKPVDPEILKSTVASVCP